MKWLVSVLLCFISGFCLAETQVRVMTTGPHCVQFAYNYTDVNGNSVTGPAQWMQPACGSLAPYTFKIPAGVKSFKLIATDPTSDSRYWESNWLVGNCQVTEGASSVEVNFGLQIVSYGCSTLSQCGCYVINTPVYKGASGASCSFDGGLNKVPSFSIPWSLPSCPGGPNCATGKCN